MSAPAVQYILTIENKGSQSEFFGPFACEDDAVQEFRTQVVAEEGGPEAVDMVNEDDWGSILEAYGLSFTVTVLSPPTFQI